MTGFTMKGKCQKGADVIGAQCVLRAGHLGWCLGGPDLSDLPSATDARSTVVLEAIPQVREYVARRRARTPTLE